MQHRISQRGVPAVLNNDIEQRIRAIRAGPPKMAKI